jgi:hypothetical protein
MARSLRPATIVLLLAGLASCGPEPSFKSNMLESVTKAEEPPEPMTGDICFLSTLDPSPGYVRMIAGGRSAMVRFRGRPLRLGFEGERIRGGGTFRGPDMSVSIEDVPRSAANSREPTDAFAHVTVTVPGRSERFIANWNCWRRDGKPAAPASGRRAA